MEELALFSGWTGARPVQIRKQPFGDQGKRQCRQLGGSIHSQHRQVWTMRDHQAQHDRRSRSTIAVSSPEQVADELQRLDP